MNQIFVLLFHEWRVLKSEDESVVARRLTRIVLWSVFVSDISTTVYGREDSKKQKNQSRGQTVSEYRIEPRVLLPRNLLKRIQLAIGQRFGHGMTSFRGPSLF